MAVSGTFTGFHKNVGSGRLEIYYKGNLVGTANASSFGAAGTVTDGSLTATTSVSATTSVTAATTLTAGTGLTVTTGNAVNSAGDSRITAGNLRLGAISTFAMTEPTSAAVMKVGTNPVGAITTSGAVFVTTGGATISKIIADGTVSTIQT